MNTQKSSSKITHIPVLLEEVIDLCSPKIGGRYLDCTFGGGGISEELLGFDNTNVLAIDRDKFVIRFAEKLKRKYPSRFNFYNEKFSNLELVAKDNFDAIIFDLGVSSFQIKNLDRVFSFNSKNNLDMSMGLNEITALQVVNNLSQQNLKYILRLFGEEKEAGIISKNIIKERKLKKFKNAQDLVKIIKKSKKKNFKNKIDPSTQSFQALRIFVNKEITELIEGISYATKLLKPNGKLIVISFHSLEDKIVKYFFKNYSENRSIGSRYFPSENTNYSLFTSYKNKIIKPSLKEINKNPSSRSAKLRYAVRSENDFKKPNELFLKFDNFLQLEKLNV